MHISRYLTIAVFTYGSAWLLTSCGPTLISKGDRLGIVSSKSLHGVIRLVDEQLIYPEIYDSAELFEKDGVVKLRRGQDYCLGTTEGQMVLNCEQRDITVGTNTGFVSFQDKNARFGLIRISDRKILVSNVDNITLFDGHGIAKAENRGKFGVIQQDGKWLCPKNSDAADVSVVASRAHVWCRKGQLWGLGAESYGRILPAEYDKISVYPDVSLIRIRKNGKEGLASYEGKVLVLPSFDDLSLIHSEGAVYRKGRLLGFVGKTGQVYTDPIYEDVRGYYVNKARLSFDAARMFAVKKNGFWGVVDGQGSVVAPVQYPPLSDWNEALIFSKSGKFGAVSYDGAIVVPFIYDSIHTPSGGRALAYIGGYEQYVYLGPEYEAAWKRKHKEEQEARQQALKEKKLEAERNAAEQLLRDRKQVQNDIDTMSKRITQILQRLDKIGHEPDPGNTFYDDERVELKTELEDLKRRIKQRERQRRDLYRN